MYFVVYFDPVVLELLMIVVRHMKQPVELIKYKI